MPSHLDIFREAMLSFNVDVLIYLFTSYAAFHHRLPKEEVDKVFHQAVATQKWALVKTIFRYYKFALEQYVEYLKLSLNRPAYLPIKKYLIDICHKLMQNYLP